MSTSKTSPAPPEAGTPSGAPSEAALTAADLPQAATTASGGTWSLVAPVRGQLALAASLVALSSLAGLVPLLGIVEVARLLLPADGSAVDSRRVWTVVITVAVALAARIGLVIAAALVSHLADARLAWAVRAALLDRLGRLPLGWFTTRSSGSIASAVQGDVGALHELVADAVLHLTAAVTIPVVVVVYLGVLDWRLLLVTLAPLVLGAAAYLMALRGGGDMMQRYDTGLKQLAAAAVELVRGIGVVKAHGPRGGAYQGFATASRGMVAVYTLWNRRAATALVVMNVALAPATTLLVVLAGGLALTQAGLTSLLDVLTFLVLGLGLTAPLTSLAHSARGLREAGQASARLRALLSEPELVRPQAPADARLLGSRVELLNVDVHYGAAQVLHQVSLVMEPGTVTALVGPSGAGKSTVAGLLPRFVEPSAGSVSIGGVDIRDLSEAALYSQVCHVFQRVGLLRASVRDNIRLARPDADQGTVEQVARAANIHDVVMGLPQGYDTVLGEGVSLSGGQAQRLSVARALLADTPVLVLDEATASMDPESEVAVQQGLSRLAVGRTLLVIAHRLATVADADQVVVLEQGRVVEQGTHQQLLEARRLYARLWAAERRADPR